MRENLKIRPAAVLGPMGEHLTLEMLPSPDTSRWVCRRKAQVVAAINGGMLSVDEACARYDLSAEEVDCWRKGYARAGVQALRVTRIQQYREAASENREN
ncbi:MAG: DUF1153 domain-containing protein [Sphingopyxis sp.]|nr:DUF1153 domain-containing protein [Sphingopyxis sp.]